MQFLCQLIQSVEFWKIAFPALAAVLAWFVNERSKLGWEQYKRKEENYKELLRCLRGFYEGAENADLKAKFLDQVNILWLYAPDDLIVNAYAFLETVQTGTVTPVERRNAACGDLVAAVRRDLLHREIVKHTKLNGTHFRKLLESEATQNTTSPLASGS